MRRLIALFTHEGESVLDPFNGAGTTTLVAEQMQRAFIGVELSEKYHSLAMRRHDELRDGLDPFRKTDVVPNSKNSHVKRLQKQRYAVSKKVLQLEVKRIAGKLGHLPSREEVARLSAYPLNYYEKYFVSWGEVCAAARTTGMSEYKESGQRSRATGQFSLF
jgi:site-specific DNA-methyltransferase (adenine-specific)